MALVQRDLREAALDRGEDPDALRRYMSELRLLTIETVTCPAVLVTAARPSTMSKDRI